ncbi:MAG: 30S ribosomal protein S20 [Candidatus Paceibacterota bacterium]
MALTKTARKQIRVSKRRKVHNDRRMKVMKSTVKDVRKLIVGGKKNEAEKLLSSAFKALDKAAKRGVIKKNTASRKKSRLAKALKKIS